MNRPIYECRAYDLGSEVEDLKQFINDLEEYTNHLEEKLSKQLIIADVIKRFIRGEVKIKIDDPTKKHIMRYIFNECGFEIKENHYTYEKDSFFWVEEGSFNSGLKHVHNSMDLLLRNKNKHTINLSELNVL